MSQIYNVYCDESCHLEHDQQKAMVLGAVWCPLEAVGRITANIRKIKKKHGIRPLLEIKWTKVSQAKLQFYRDLVNYFFADDDLYFRALIVPDKSILRHEDFDQTHDDWYYKMYFDMLKKIILNDRSNIYRIYLDIKDTRSEEKVIKLSEVLRNSLHDFSAEIIDRVQHVRSQEVTILQLADLLIGAVSYVNRGMSTSKAKLNLVSLMQACSGYDLTSNTLYREDKVNLLCWQPKGRP